MGVNVSSRPGLSNVPELQEYGSPRVPESWSPMVAEAAWSMSSAKRIRITSDPSSKITSKSAVPVRFA